MARHPKAAGRYALDNGKAGARPHTPAPLEADCQEIQDTVRVLLATLGYPVFEAVGKSATKESAEVFFCRTNGADGRGLYTPEGFVVLKGSTGRRESVPSLKNTAHARFRARLLGSGLLRVEGEQVVMVRDYVFASLSMAAVALLGRTANGWVEWKTVPARHCMM